MKLDSDKKTETKLYKRDSSIKRRVFFVAKNCYANCAAVERVTVPASIFRGSFFSFVFFSTQENEIFSPKKNITRSGNLNVTHTRKPEAGSSYSRFFFKKYIYM